jgi:hypothetical protein
VVGPKGSGVTDDLCTRLLTDVRPADSILSVSIGQSTTDHRRHMGDHGPLAAFDVEYIEVDTETANAGEQHAAEPSHVTTVTDPTDLAALERTIADRLAAADGQTTLCFHSVTAVLGFVERERTLEFLHTLTDEVDATDTYAHYHLDIDAHDAETIEMLGTVTDRVIALDRDGSDVSIR